jgi:hypothetical protein
MKEETNQSQSRKDIFCRGSVRRSVRWLVHPVSRDVHLDSSDRSLEVGLPGSSGVVVRIRRVGIILEEE